MTFHRATRVAEAIRHEVADIVLHRLKDIRVESARVSITDVEVTRDLRHATIFVSVLGDDDKREGTLEGLRSACGFIRSEVGKAVKLRAVPELHFKLDSSLEKGANILALMNKIKEERESRESAED